MAANVFKQELTQKLGEGTLSYAAQRAYVGSLLQVSGHLLVAASYADAEIQRELASMPEGLVIGFSILGDELSMRLRVQGGRLGRMPARHPADLDIIFKHVTHAFMVLSFQETTPQAFANQRFITQGDAALSMRFTRCLNRMQLVTLPALVTKRAFPNVPQPTLSEKLGVSAKLYANLARLLARGPTRSDSAGNRP
jgi:hypothetical protein